MSSFQIETEGSAIDELYESLEPFHRIDQEVGYHLQKYITSIAGMLQEIENYSRDNGDIPGWGEFVTVEGTPRKALPWLGQFVGVKIPGNLTEEQERFLVSDKSGFRRGSPGAMRAAAQVYLTGTKTVNLYERDTSAYHLTVQTYESETPPEDLPTTNIIPNGGFETNLTGWSTSANQRSTDYAHSGVASLKSSGATYEYTTVSIPVAVGDVFVVSVWRKCVGIGGGGGQASVVVEPGTGAYTQVSLPGSAPQSASGTRDWERVMTKYTITNAGAGTMPLILTAMYGGTGFGFAYFDDVQVERKAIATPYVHTDGAPASRLAGQGPVGAALRSQKPAGIVMVYTITSGQTYQQLKTGHPLYSQVKSYYSNYDKVRSDVP